ncbi:helix-turn-helix transcriptional regulator [Thorsellia anophelis]|uniref:Transcriptional regulator, AlpA family n=1 Tax=Thorsellia anophelis DSM 18579 TaxID=1123402 RepID=A0A1I0CVA9_9GAMM|nr:AlpA family phage regulatory protein [Thorsellia anophelis]SET23733.1 transcriptional regulator, AlpA family [Thorsellia anophelis DSM 18579]
MEQTQLNNLANTKLVDMKFITHKTGLTDKWFYKLIQLNQFPKPIKLGRSSRWLESDFNNWLLDKINKSKSQSSY